MSYLIKEVLFDGDVIEGKKIPEYKNDFEVNVEQLDLVRPTKNPLVLKIIIRQHEVFILKSDYEQYKQTIQTK